MLKRLKYSLWISKQWLKKLYEYPQDKIVPGEHFNYDEYWKEKRAEYIGSLGRAQAKRANLAAEIILKFQGKSVNDIGSGSGEVLKVIKEKAKLDSAIAYDSSSYALKIAESFGLKTKLFDINKSEDFKLIESADFTIMFEVLEHIPGSEELLKEAMNKSKKGALFSFPNTGFIIHRSRLFFFGRFPLEWQKHPAEHLRFWTKRDLIWWLNAQGYKNYLINYYMGIPFLKRFWPGLFASGFFVQILK